MRISHSGDGCGTHWPLCQGQYMVQEGATSKTWIEWTHRATSGLFGLGVLGLFIWALIIFPIRHAVVKTASMVLFFTITEGLLGAKLVLAGLTGSNSSLARALTMNGHLLNSLLLTSSLFICWRRALGHTFALSKNKLLVILGFFLIAFLGSLSALAGSLFPSMSLLSGLALDFNPDSHWLIRWRVVHPILALTLAGGFFWWLFFRDPHEFRDIQGAGKTNKLLKKWQNKLGFNSLFKIFLFLALLTGVFNLLLLSPVLLKLLHLLMVYALVLSFLFTLEKP